MVYEKRWLLESPQKSYWSRGLLITWWGFEKKLLGTKCHFSRLKSRFRKDGPHFSICTVAKKVRILVDFLVPSFFCIFFLVFISFYSEYFKAKDIALKMEKTKKIPKRGNSDILQIFLGPLNKRKNRKKTLTFFGTLFVRTNLILINWYNNGGDLIYWCFGLLHMQHWSGVRFLTHIFVT